LKRLRWGARLRILEALVYLAAARLALQVFSFAHLAAFFAHTSPDRSFGAERAKQRTNVRWAIRTACFYLPGVTSCFPQAIAAQAMLRRRGISTVLYYGAATLSTRALKAHVWLQDGSIGIVGHEIAPDYHIIAQYPQLAPTALRQSPG